MNDYERVLLVKKEIFVYKILPRQSSRGYRAGDWKLDEPFYTGRLRVLAQSDKIILRIEDKNTGALFADCPIDEFPGVALESVSDSSRYFVIRLMAKTGQTQYVGIGFQERNDSFDLNVTISDFFKQVKTEKECDKGLVEQPNLNLGLREGQKITLNLNTKRTGDMDYQQSVLSKSKQKPSGGNQIGLLPPPPPSSTSRHRLRGVTSGETSNALSMQNTTHWNNAENNNTSSSILDDSTYANLNLHTENNGTTSEISVPKTETLSFIPPNNNTASATPSNVDLLSDIFGASGSISNHQQMPVNPIEQSATSWADFG